MHQNAPHYSHVPQVLSCCMVLAGSKRECLSIPNSSFSYITTPIISLKYPTAWFSGGLKCGKRGTNVQSNAIHNFPWYLSRLGFLCVILLVLLAQINPEKVHLEHPSTIGANSINNWCKYLPTFLPHSFSCVNFHCQVPLHGTSHAAPRSIVEVQESWSQMLSRTPSPHPFFARKSWNIIEFYWGHQLRPRLEGMLKTGDLIHIDWSNLLNQPAKLVTVWFQLLSREFQNDSSLLVTRKLPSHIYIYMILYII